MFLKNEIKKRIKNEKGLTLIELLAVIVILAIIAAIAIPAIGNIINNSRDKATLSDVQAALSAAKIARADGSCTTPCTGAQFEFSSDKVKNDSNDKEIISIAFDSNGKAVITTTLEENLKGTRISDAITTEKGKISEDPSAYTAGSDSTNAQLVISETVLNKVLGGN